MGLFNDQIEERDGEGTEGGVIRRGGGGNKR